jgi:D-lactate dehydrogenase (cytochrome)
MALVEGGTCYSTDVCVPVSKLPQLVRETQEDLRKHGIVGPLLG